MKQSVASDPRRGDGASNAPARVPSNAWMSVAAISALVLGTVGVLQAQSQGEVQVTARVLTLVPVREAALAAAANPAAPKSSQLFRITRVRHTELPTTSTPKREELIVVVEFLAN